MGDYTVKHLDDMASQYGGAFVLARASLGVSAFGMQVFQLPPEWAGPEHCHDGMTGESAESANDGQEEVYFGIGGKAYLGLGDEEIELGPDVMVRVGPAQMRQLRTRDEPAKVLVVGAVPGGAYSAPAFTEIPAEVGS
jgi:mannose-6-phosphate isomerase-like protein (cupin superfamily)